MPLDTLLNYPGAVVLSKSEMYTEVYRIIAIRIKTESRYEVKEIKIPRNEWIMVNIGDTIDNINIKTFVITTKQVLSIITNESVEIGDTIK